MTSLRITVCTALCIGAALALAACSSAPDAPPVIGEAFAGPASLPMRKDVDTKSAVIATLHHGDHLDITGQRRTLYRVRTQKGIEGWVDGRQLLDKAQMDRLRQLSAETADLPTQGAAKAFDTLNVHTEPNRQSPSFIQVKEGEKFDVITHRVTARVSQAPRRQLIAPKPKPAPKLTKSKAKSKSGDVQLPPPPSPPAVDWTKLSMERGPQAEADTPPAAQDDWTLIRTESGQSGWVLTSRVYMSIPDDVAQYAEGHRITSYFSIGTVEDHGDRHDIWMWTTIQSLGQDIDFDGYRVFTWSTRRNHYETAYIQRRIRGYLPVVAKPGEFSVCIENANGARVRKHYTLTGNSVRQTSEQPCEAMAETVTGAPVADPGVKVQPPPKAKPTIVQKLKSLVGM